MAESPFRRDLGEEAESQSAGHHRVYVDVGEGRSMSPAAHRRDDGTDAPIPRLDP